MRAHRRPGHARRAVVAGPLVAPPHDRCRPRLSAALASSPCRAAPAIPSPSSAALRRGPGARARRAAGATPTAAATRCRCRSRPPRCRRCCRPRSPTPLLSVRRAPAAAGQRPPRATCWLDAVAGAGGARRRRRRAWRVGIDDRVIAGANTPTLGHPGEQPEGGHRRGGASKCWAPGTVFTTKVVGPAPVNGVVDGDVYLVGGGDPVLSEQWYTADHAVAPQAPAAQRHQRRGARRRARRGRRHLASPAA